MSLCIVLFYLWLCCHAHSFCIFAFQNFFLDRARQCHNWIIANASTKAARFGECDFVCVSFFYFFAHSQESKAAIQHRSLVFRNSLYCLRRCDVYYYILFFMFQLFPYQTYMKIKILFSPFNYDFSTIFNASRWDYESEKSVHFIFFRVMHGKNTWFFILMAQRKRKHSGT